MKSQPTPGLNGCWANVNPFRMSLKSACRSNQVHFDLVKVLTSPEHTDGLNTDRLNTKHVFVFSSTCTRHHLTSTDERILLLIDLMCMFWLFRSNLQKQQFWCQNLTLLHPYHPYLSWILFQNKIWSPSQPSKKLVKLKFFLFGFLICLGQKKMTTFSIQHKLVSAPTLDEPPSLHL